MPHDNLILIPTQLQVGGATTIPLFPIITVITTPVMVIVVVLIVIAEVTVVIAAEGFSVDSRG